MPVTTEAACQRIYKCSSEQVRTLKRIGDAMMQRGAKYRQTPRGAFTAQKTGAYFRGVGWELTIWEWWTIWEESGHWPERGRSQGYVMCRRGDEGPYAVGNVFIAPARVNSSDVKIKRKWLPIGVTINGGRFLARRKFNGKHFCLGTYDTPEEAHAAYLNARQPQAAKPTGKNTGRSEPPAPEAT